MNISKFAATALLAALLVSCTSYRAYQEAVEFEKLENWDKAVVKYAEALEVDPHNARYQMALERAKMAASRAHFEKAKSLRAAGHLELAALELELVVKLDPTNQYAAVELAKAIRALRESKENDITIAEKKRRVTMEKAQPPQLNPASDQPITLSFPRPTPVKDIYQALGNSFGINVLFDQSVKDDSISIELRDVTARAALERVMQAAGHFYKVLDEKTIIVVTDTPQLRREYEDLVIRTFYLSNADAEMVTNVLRTMLDARSVFSLKSLNAITIRDTADKVRIAEKIIEANDKAKAEVVVNVELLQLDMKKARDLGLQLANASGAGGFIDATGKAITAVTLPELRGLTSNDFAFTIPSVAYGFVKNNSDAKLLAKPELRISEGEKAQLTIGEQVPVPVTTFTTANIGTPNTGTYAPFTSYQYKDVGIKISIEPRVHHNREVTLKLTVEVSNLAGYVGDSNQPIIATRTIESTIRLRDGETNFLAGLIRQDDNSNRNSTPFLGDLPILGRLFTRENTNSSQTDLVLTMTPHIVRVADITEEDLAPMWVATQSNMTFRGASPRLESRSPGDPFAPPAGDQFGGPAPVPAPGMSEAPLEEPPMPGVPMLPPGTGPTDAFREVTPAPQPRVPRPPTRVNEDAKLAPDGGTIPRVAVQPVHLKATAGEIATWRIVGLDLHDLSAGDLVIHYDPTVIAILSADIGSAFAIDLANPPAVTLDAITGTITVRATAPGGLRFQAGGDVIVLRLRGLRAAETFLVVNDPGFTGADSLPVLTAVAGGKAFIE
jgi:general secretion pathway protein D